MEIQHYSNSAIYSLEPLTFKRLTNVNIWRKIHQEITTNSQIDCMYLVLCRISRVLTNSLRLCWASTVSRWAFRICAIRSNRSKFDTSTSNLPQKLLKPNSGGRLQTSVISTHFKTMFRKIDFNLMRQFRPNW